MVPPVLTGGTWLSSLAAPNTSDVVAPNIPEPQDR